VQGRTAFNPTLLKLGCGEHEQYTTLKRTQWLDYGTGMISMYKSDWIDVGGRFICCCVYNRTSFFHRRESIC